MTRWWCVQRAFNWFLSFLLLSAVSLLTGLQNRDKDACQTQERYWPSQFLGGGGCDFATKAEFGPGCSYIVACGRLWKGERKMPVCLLFTTRATYILSWSSQELSFGAKEDVVAHQDYDQHVWSRLFQWHPLVVGLSCLQLGECEAHRVGYVHSLLYQDDQQKVGIYIL